MLPAVNLGPQERLAHQWKCLVYYLDTNSSEWTQAGSGPSTLCLYTTKYGSYQLVCFETDGKVRGSADGAHKCASRSQWLPPSPRTRYLAPACSCSFKSTQDFETMSELFLAWNGPDRYYGASFNTHSEQARLSPGAPLISSRSMPSRS